MEDAKTLRYHAEAFRVVGYEPRVSPEALRAITEFEAERAGTLAGAVREFFIYGGEGLHLGDGSDWYLVSLKTHLDDLKDLRWAQFRSNPGLTDGREFVVLSDTYCNIDYQVYLVVDGSDDPWVEDNMRLNPRGPFSAFILHLAREKARLTASGTKWRLK
jgi:hypothetical protein